MVIRLNFIDSRGGYSVILINWNEGVCFPKNWSLSLIICKFKWCFASVNLYMYLSVLIRKITSLTGLELDFQYVKKLSISQDIIAFCLHDFHCRPRKRMTIWSFYVGLSILRTRFQSDWWIFRSRILKNFRNLPVV